MSEGLLNWGPSEPASYEHTREVFLSLFPLLRDEILGDELYKGTPGFSQDWLREMLDYTVPGGKLNRGMAVYDVVRSIKKAEDITREDILKANVAGWCIEWLQAFFLVADDIMDGSITRRGLPCWYKKKEVGLVACNDYIILECCIYRFLKKVFRNDSYYAQLLDIFLETTCQTAHGQLLDLITTPVDKVDLTRYTIENYFSIVTFKTAYYSFYMPVACGLIVSGVNDPAAFELAKSILIPMGQYFQVQDDFLDCFADPALSGKIGTDIQDNKCSWLICQALSIGNEDQKKKIMENYAKDNKENIEAVKAVYRDLKLEDLFHEYEAQSYKKLISLSQDQELLPKEVFTRLLEKIYKRQK